MKILHFSDLHFKESRYFKTNDFIETLSSIYNSALENNIFHIIFSGDFFDKKSNPRWMYDELVMFFINANKCHWYIGVGNHDKDKKGHGLEIFDIIRKHGNLEHITILELPCVLELDKYKIKIEHGIIKGSVLDNEYTVKEDMIDIDINDLKGYDYVALGHLHIAQKIQYEDIFGYYAGSPLHLNFGESEQKKGWLIVDVENKKVTPIKNKNYTPFINIDVFYEFLSNEFEIKNKIPEKCFIKFRVRGNAKQIALFKSYEAKRIADKKLYIVEGIIQNSIDFESLRKNINSKNIEDDIDDYFMALQVEDGIDKNSLMKKAKKLIQEARDAS